MPKTSFFKKIKNNNLNIKFNINIIQMYLTNLQFEFIKYSRFDLIQFFYINFFFNIILNFKILLNIENRFQI